MLEIRKAVPGHSDEIGEIIREVISAGHTYVFAPDTSRIISDLPGAFHAIDGTYRNAHIMYRER